MYVYINIDTQLSFQIKRMVPLEVYTGQVAGRQQRLLLKKEESIRKVAANTAPKVYMYTCIYLYVFLFIYVYIYICVYVCINVYT
jgi:hypothetical protein